LGKNLKNIFFLTADAFGVLPPISRLLPSQAAYHFISGYTAKVAGTEAGIVEPVPSFSSCFGAPFMPLHPTVYAKMLIKKMKDLGVNVWLVNTGWSGGPYGTGSRIKLKYTRRMVNAALNGELGDYNYKDYHIHSVFGLAQPRECPGIPKKLLSPRASWSDDKAYYKMAFKLSNAFRKNFNQFEEIANEEIKRGGPQRFSNNLFDFNNKNKT
jgi:phosphoenolpyruvate carboxykinase (ATP)